MKENIVDIHRLAVFLFPPAKNLMIFEEAERKVIVSNCKTALQPLQKYLNSSRPREQKKSNLTYELFKDCDIIPDTDDNDIDPI